MHYMVTSPTGSVISAVLKKIESKNCTNKSFTGSFEFDMTGAFIGGPLGGPFKRVGTLTSDGKGGFIASTVADYGGFIVVENFDGTYQVDSSCTMTMKHVLNGVNVTLVGPVVEGGDGAFLIVSTAALAGNGPPVLNAITGTLRRQHVQDGNEDHGHGEGD